MTQEVDPLSTEHFNHITILEELVCSPGRYARHFTFEPSEIHESFDEYHPELGPRIDLWQVMLGDKLFLLDILQIPHFDIGSLGIFKDTMHVPSISL